MTPPASLRAHSARRRDFATPRARRALRRGIALVAGLALAVGVTACAAQDPAPAPTSSTAPTETAAPTPTETAQAGFLVTGTRYSYTAPAGWEILDISGDATADSVALLRVSAGVDSTITVVLPPTGPTTLEQIEAAALPDLEQLGATDVVLVGRTEVAGVEALHITATLSTEGATAAVDQFSVPHLDNTYVIMFMTDSAMTDADRSALLDSVLSTWQWD